MLVSASELGAYTQQVTAQQDAAYSFVQGALLSYWDLNGGALTWEDMEAFAEQVFQTCAEQFGGQAASVACDAYDATMNRLGISYARVPTGKETCGFCLMLASRGFDYKSRESAGYTRVAFNRFHDRCDCRVVAGDSTTVVEGYDPDWLYDAYLDARETVNPEGIRASMPGAEASDVNKRITDSICNELNMRSRGWSWEGKPADSMDSEYSKWTDQLAAHGLATSITGRGGAPLRMNGLSWGMGDATGGSVTDSIAGLRKARSDGGTKTDGHYVVLVDGMGVGDVAWTATDITNALMALPNIILVFLVAGTVGKETQHYVYDGNIDEECTDPIPQRLDL